MSCDEFFADAGTNSLLQEYQPSARYQNLAQHLHSLTYTKLYLNLADSTHSVLS